MNNKSLTQNNTSIINDEFFNIEEKPIKQEFNLINDGNIESGDNIIKQEPPKGEEKEEENEENDGFEIDKDISSFSEKHIVEELNNAYKDNGFIIQHIDGRSITSPHKGIEIKAPNGKTQMFYYPNSDVRQEGYNSSLFKAESPEERKKILKELNKNRIFDIQTFIKDNKDKEAWEETQGVVAELNSIGKNIIKNQDWREHFPEADNINMIYNDPEKNASFESYIRNEIKSRYHELNPDNNPSWFISLLEQRGVGDYRFDKIVDNVIQNGLSEEKAVKLAQDRKAYNLFKSKNEFSTDNARSFLYEIAHNNIINIKKKEASKKWREYRELENNLGDVPPNKILEYHEKLKQTKQSAEELTKEYKGENTKFWFKHNDEGLVIPRSGNEIEQGGTDITKYVELSKEELNELLQKDYSKLQDSFELFQVELLNFENNLDKKFNVSVNGPQGRFHGLDAALLSKGYKSKDGVFSNVSLRDMVSLSKYQNSTWGNFDHIKPSDLDNLKESSQGLISQGSMTNYVKILEAQNTSNQAKKIAYEDIYLLNIDPASIERDNFFETGLRSNFGITFGESNSETLKTIENIMRDSGINITENQAKNFQQSWAEMSGDLVFSLPKIGLEFALANKLTAGLSFASGLNKIQKAYMKTNTFLSRTKALGITAMKEAFTMQVVTGDAVTGAGFAIAGKHYNTLSKFLGVKFKGIYSPLNKVILDPIKGGFSFTTAAQAASFLKAASDDMLGGKDFNTFMEDKFSNIDFMEEGGLGREYFSEFLTGVIFSATKIKGHDVSLLRGKGDYVLQGLLKELKTAENTFINKVSPDGKLTRTRDQSKIESLRESIFYIEQSIKEMDVNIARNDPKQNKIKVSNDLKRIQNRLKKELNLKEAPFDFEVVPDGKGMDGNPAMFKPKGINGKPTILIDASKYKEGMLAQEVFHFVASNLGINSPKSMGKLRNIIEPEVNKLLKAAGFKDFDLKKIIKEKYFDQNKDTRPEEYIANLIELIQKNKKFKRILTRRTILAHLKQKTTSFVNRTFKGTPLENKKIEINTVEDLLKFFDRWGSDLTKPGADITGFSELVFMGDKIFNDRTGNYNGEAKSSKDLLKDLGISDKNIEISKRNEDLNSPKYFRKNENGEKVFTEEARKEVYENNLLKAQQLANKAANNPNILSLEQGKRISPEDWLAGYKEQLLKLIDSYRPEKTEGHFGHYLMKNLHKRYGDILKGLKSNIETRGIENDQIVDTAQELSVIENVDLSFGQSGGRKKDITINPIDFLTGEKIGGEFIPNKKEAALLNNIIKNDLEKVDLSKKSYSDLIPSNELIKSINDIFSGGQKIKFKKEGGLKLDPEGKPIIFKANEQVIESQKAFIKENAETLYNMLPYAAKLRSKGLKTSTKIAPVIIRNLYETGKRVSTQTGTTAGLAKQTKPPWSPEVEAKFLKLFGADGSKLNKKSKEYRNQITAINALIRETAKSTLNSAARKKDLPIEILQQLADGKSDYLSSKDIDLLYPKGADRRKIQLAAGLMINNNFNEAESKYPLEYNALMKDAKNISLKHVLIKTENAALEKIMKDQGIPKEEAIKQILEETTNYNKLRETYNYSSDIKTEGGKKLVGERWIELNKEMISELIPKGSTFRELPVDVQAMIVNTVHFGNTRLLINNKSLTYLAWDKELKEHTGLDKIITSGKKKNVTHADLIEVVFGKIEGKGEKYKGNLNDAKHIANWGNVKKLLEKWESEGLTHQEAARRFEKEMAKNNDINKTQNVNKELLNRVYGSYVNRLIKNPSKETIEDIVDNLQVLTNQATSIHKGNIPTTSITIKGETGVGKSEARFHNEHKLPFFQMNRSIIKHMQSFKDGKINAKTLRQRVSDIVLSAEQAIISKRQQEIKDSDGASTVKNFSQDVFLSEQGLKDQITIGVSGNPTLAEKIAGQVNAREILEILNLENKDNLTPVGVQVKQRLENKKDYALTLKKNKYLGKEAGVDTKNKVNSEITEALKEKDLDNKNKLIESYASRDLSLEFNEIIENKTGIGRDKVYSRVKAQVAGFSKGKGKFFVPPSAEDFVGLLYTPLGKGKLGDSQMAWYKNNLLDPYSRAMYNINSERSTIINDYKHLKKQLKIVPKNLRKKLSDEPFTNEQAVRVYIWNKQGMEVPGLSKTDLKKLTSFIENKPELTAFADQLIAINKGDGYAGPKDFWTSGNIASDLLEGLNTTKRAKYLEPWQKNVDQIFSEANLNKLEAAYGKGYREALEGTLQRMKTGRNRINFGGADSITSRFTDWLTNSIGAVMFFNTRSALLQTTSIANYVNFKDNNPLAAMKAVLNVPQYSKDFLKLINSDLLKARRDGLKMNVSEADIADMAKDPNNFGRRLVAWTLKKGFLPTQYADSFAIASGGATFYRNRINSYIKEGMSKKAAEKQAFLDFQELTETSQQSSRPDKISQQQASPLGRVILAWANTPMQYTREIKKAALDLKNGRGDVTTNISKIIYYGGMQNLIFNSMQQALFAVAFDEDEEQESEEKKKKYFDIVNSMSDQFLRGSGVYGAVVSTIKNSLIKLNKEMDKKSPRYNELLVKELAQVSPPLGSKIRKLDAAGKSFSWNKKEMKEKGWALDNPAYLASANIISAVTNIPADRAIKKISNLSNAMNTDLQTWQRVASLGGWSSWQLGINKPKSKPKKKTKSKKKSTKRVTKR